MTVSTAAELPATHRCRKCRKKKPIAEMMVVRLRKLRKILLRPRCKDCNNSRERGHRRPWKRAYLRRWRRDNAALNESYWRQRQAEKRKELNAAAERRRRRHHDALLIQGRFYADSFIAPEGGERKDGGKGKFVIKPSRQPVPYQFAAARLRNWQAERRAQRAMKAAA